MFFIKTSLKSILRFIFSWIAVQRLNNCSEKPIANGFTLLSKKTCLGNNVNFNGFRIYGNGDVSIGDNFHSGKGCYIITQVHNYNGCKIPYDSSYSYKSITIEDNVWFGMNVAVLSSCVIGEGAIIQAGSVVVSDIPKYAIAGGNPARVFSYRDKVHYEKLKADGSFH